MTAILVGCSRRKVNVSAACAAINLYQGGCVPSLRTIIQQGRLPTTHAFIVSARYGLLNATDKVIAYDEVLTLEKAKTMQHTIADAVRERIVKGLHESEVIVLLEPLYFVTLGGLLAQDDCPRLFWFPDPVRDWGGALEALRFLQRSR